jgi:hypothetical protein
LDFPLRRTSMTCRFAVRYEQSLTLVQVAA